MNLPVLDLFFPALVPWKVTVGAQTICLPYAEAKDDPRDSGMRELLYADHLLGAKWNRLWLSPMNWSLRKWNVYLRPHLA